MAISEKQFQDSATALNVPVSAIKAVAKIEGGGIGMQDNRPIILFEPHIFYRLLKQSGITPVVSDICYPVWGSRPYPLGQKAKWDMLDKAVKINRDLALQSASWGLFQILGSNYRATGCKTIQDFVNAMYEGEDKQLDLFCKYIKNVGLDDELRMKDWAMFASGYNGKYYYKNAYDKKLQRAYESFA